jgi:hypothetical protein
MTDLLAAGEGAAACTPRGGRSDDGGGAPPVGRTPTVGVVARLADGEGEGADERAVMNDCGVCDLLSSAGSLTSGMSGMISRGRPGDVHAFSAAAADDDGGGDGVESAGGGGGGSSRLLALIRRAPPPRLVREI